MDLNTSSLFYLMTYFGCMLSFWISQLKIFRHNEQKDFKLVVILRTFTVLTWNLGYISFLLLAHPSIVQVLIALFLNLISLTLFWQSAHAAKQKLSAAFSKDLPAIHLTSGPFRYLRHPFYASYNLFFLGIIITQPTQWVSILSAGMMAYYFFAAYKEEKKFAQSHLAKSYEEYKKKTGMFLPKLMPKI